MPNNQRKKGHASNNDIIIGQNIRRVRVLKGWSQQELGDHAGVTFQQIQKYEKGTNRVSASRLLDFAKALDVDFKVFYGSLLKQDAANDTGKLSSNVLKILRLLENIEDKKLLKQIENIIRSLSNVKH